TRAGSRPAGTDLCGEPGQAARPCRARRRRDGPVKQGKEKRMGLGATVGADLLAVPFPKMVLSLAQAIAKGQLALDQASLNTLKVLSRTKFDYIPEITEVLSPRPFTTHGIEVTGVDVEAVASPPLSMTLLQAG